MKSILAFAVGVAFAVAALVTCGGKGPSSIVDARAATPTSWEYAIFSTGSQWLTSAAGTDVPRSTFAPDCKDEICVLNYLGSQGWELVASGSNTSSERLFFKRPK